MFSRALHQALTETLARDEQAILFLNRRGNSTCVLCRDCGYVAKCPNCDVPFTHHQSENYAARLVCHLCNAQQTPPTVCPQCGGRHIRYLGAGTASVETAIKAAFPNAQALRWDRDTASGRADHEAIFDQFAGGQANVLIGTQMVVKGLDLPRVTLVAAILADSGLGLPDYRAGERTFQLLTQAAGRAGRAARPGSALLQTYQPDHYAIRAAANHDYALFYRQEISYRQALAYPPFKRLVRFIFRSQGASEAAKIANIAMATLRQQAKQQQLTATSFIGPSPSYYGKVDGVYQWQIIARTSSPQALLANLATPPSWIIEIDPVDVL
jgi:primosomal protein N' (replication factor Y) (superfamily II helicase)